MPITLDVATLPNGVSLPYAEHGDRNGTPLVLLHGLTDSWRSFELVLPHLPAGVHAYAVTQRGHGDASRTASYAVDEMAGDVAAFMDAVGLESAIVCGHSMGSLVASRLAIIHPERVDALVIAGGAPSFATLDIDEMTAELETLSDPVDPDYLRGFQESTLAQPVQPEVVDTAVAESSKVPLDAFRGAWHGTILSNFAGELGAISAPTLVVWGEKDVYCGREAQDELLAAIPGARLVVFEGAGHAFHWEEPARFAATLGAFAEEVQDRC